MGNKWQLLTDCIIRVLEHQWGALKCWGKHRSGVKMLFTNYRHRSSPPDYPFCWPMPACLLPPLQHHISRFPSTKKCSANLVPPLSQDWEFGHHWKTNFLEHSAIALPVSIHLTEDFKMNGPSSNERQVKKPRICKRCQTWSLHGHNHTEISRWATIHKLVMKWVDVPMWLRQA